MEPFDLLIRLADEFDRMRVDYFVTGSMATIFYGEPRLTNDVDVVVKLELKNLPHFSKSFPEEDFYCSPQMIESAVRTRRQFNIIHPASGLKADVIVSDQSTFNQSRFSRRIRRKVAGEKAVWFASPEDVILKKLLYYQEGQSEKHIRDILGVLKIQDNKIDFDYLSHWAIELDVVDLWQAVLARTHSDHTERDSAD